MAEAGKLLISLEESLKKVEEKLELKMKKIKYMKEEGATKAEFCKREILREKEEVMKKFDDMIEEAEKIKKESVADAEKELEAGTGNLTLLRSLKTSEASKEGLQEIQNKMKVVKLLEENADTLKTLNHPKYQRNPGRLEGLFGAVMKKEPLVDFLGITSASQLKCKAEKSLATEFLWFRMDVNSDSTILVAGPDKYQYRLKQLDVHSQETGVELGSVDLRFEPWGLAVVELGGRKMVAVSERHNHLIEFRDINNLGSVLYSHKMEPHTPTGLCVLSPSTLLYEDHSKDPREVHILDCSGAKPKPATGKNVIKTQLAGISDMFVARDGDRELLICSGYNEKLNAINIATDELVWSVERKLDGMQEDMNPLGVTTDGRGHLYVCDANNQCIQMFHVADGRYLGALQVDGSTGWEDPYDIRWCEATTSLVFVDRQNQKRVVFAVSLKPN